ncbi:Fe-S-containing hydro-lyase [Haloplasma contractile]|uniref:Fumarate hydratase class I protein n=1 Tax=Haloplasma contractile SSD-17B TaxID=1033810 RepID=U2ECW5_9MOLU|nr:fumarate hydratase class I protein [Haloplasma contractile SSD-17B]
MDITTPLTDEVVKQLKAGEKVKISGIIYTARDAAHKRLVELIKKGKKLPFDVDGQIIYYVGPTPSKPGQVIGSSGPTTSYRMDPYTEPLLEKGLNGMIGKGPRNQEIKDALEKNNAVYFAAVGGAAALISKCVKRSEIIAYDDLGAEAIRKLEVKDFPAIVINDCYGNDLMEENIKKYNINGGRNTDG